MYLVHTAHFVVHLRGKHKVRKFLLYPTLYSTIGKCDRGFLLKHLQLSSNLSVEPAMVQLTRSIVLETGPCAHRPFFLDPVSQ